jgi:hypothetical protein
MGEIGVRKNRSTTLRAVSVSDGRGSNGGCIHQHLPELTRGGGVHDAGVALAAHGLHLKVKFTGLTHKLQALTQQFD